MKFSTREQNVAMITAIAVTFIALFIVLAFAGCDGDIENPTASMEESEYNQPSTNIDNDEPITENIEINVGIVQDENGLPHIVTHPPKINPDEADIPLPELIVDVDLIINKNDMELNQHFGDPINVIAGKNDALQMRFYEIHDGNVIQIVLRDNVISNIMVYYRRGYPNSIKALNAAGFLDAELTPKGIVPRKNEDGTINNLQDTYSAVTDTRIYKHISAVLRGNGTWGIVFIMP